MKRTSLMVAVLLLSAAACSRTEPQSKANNQILAANGENAPESPTLSSQPSQPASAAPRGIAPAAPPAPGTSGGLPDDRTPLPEPKGLIDPKSAEAAGQVVQHYGALIEQKRWTESWKLWSDANAAKNFDQNWRDDSAVHVNVGKPSGMEGAAGSSYVTVPVVFYGKTNAGGSFRRRAEITLRRVNDVPGSTEAQRRWHIERIDWGAGA